LIWKPKIKNAVDTMDESEKGEDGQTTNSEMTERLEKEN